MSGGVRIRPVRREDQDALRALREHAGWDVDKVPAWIAASLAGTRPTWVAELAPEHGAEVDAPGAGPVVGMVSLERTDADPEVADGGRTAAVTSLSVLPVAARRGLGRALTLHAEAAARALGVEVLTLNTRPTNAAALALYGALGYVAWKEQERPWGRAVFLRKRLGPSGADAR